MSTQSNAVSESPLTSHAAAPMVISPGRSFYWSVRRELWENRWIYLAPIAVAALIVLGALIGSVHNLERLREAQLLDAAQQQMNFTVLSNLVSLVLMGTAFLMTVIYCLGALHGERRDRSILFWKSLPVSDFTTVLSKAAIPYGILPVLALVLTVAVHVAVLLIMAGTLAASGQGMAILWEHLPLARIWLVLLYHLVTIHILWYAPIYAYLLMISAWARRALFLWAVLPPVSICIVEKIAFGTSYVFSVLQERLTGNSSGAVFASGGGMSLAAGTQLTPLNFMATPGLWLGLVFAAVCLAAAVRIRRSQGPI